MGSQPTVVVRRGSGLERNRAAALSMIPNTKAVVSITDIILPKLAGQVNGCTVGKIGFSACTYGVAQKYCGACAKNTSKVPAPLVLPEVQY